MDAESIETMDHGDESSQAAVQSPVAGENRPDVQISGGQDESNGNQDGAANETDAAVANTDQEENRIEEGGAEGTDAGESVMEYDDVTSEFSEGEGEKSKQKDEEMPFVPLLANRGSIVTAVCLRDMELFTSRLEKFRIAQPSKGEAAEEAEKTKIADPNTATSGSGDHNQEASTTSWSCVQGQDTNSPVTSGIGEQTNPYLDSTTMGGYIQNQDNATTSKSCEQIEDITADRTTNFVGEQTQNNSGSTTCGINKQTEQTGDNSGATTSTSAIPTQELSVPTTNISSEHTQDRAGSITYVSSEKTQDRASSTTNSAEQMSSPTTSDSHVTPSTSGSQTQESGDTGNQQQGTTVCLTNDSSEQGDTSTIVLAQQVSDIITPTRDATENSTTTAAEDPTTSETGTNKAEENSTTSVAPPPLSVPRLVLTPKAELSHAVMVAITTQQSEMLDKLLEVGGPHGVDLHMLDTWCPLICTAVESGSVAMLKVILKHCKDIKVKGYYGDVLQSAVRSGNLELVQLLLGSGEFDINAKSEANGTTVFMTAVRNVRLWPGGEIPTDPVFTLEEQLKYSHARKKSTGTGSVDHVTKSAENQVTNATNQNNGSGETEIAIETESENKDGVSPMETDVPEGDICGNTADNAQTMGTAITTQSTVSQSNGFEQNENSENRIEASIVNSFRTTTGQENSMLQSNKTRSDISSHENQNFGVNNHSCDGRTTTVSSSHSNNQSTTTTTCVDENSTNTTVPSTLPRTQSNNQSTTTNSNSIAATDLYSAYAESITNSGLATSTESSANTGPTTSTESSANTCSTTSTEPSANSDPATEPSANTGPTTTTGSSANTDPTTSTESGKSGPAKSEAHECQPGPYRHNLRLLQLLLDRGANLNAKDKEGRTALHLAAQLGYAQVCEFLLRHGADRSVRDDKERTPLMVALYLGQAHLYETLLPTNGDVNTTIEGLHDCSTLLHFAAGYCSPGAVRFLLDKGADPLIKSERKQVPLCLAVEKYNLATGAVLAGCRPNGVHEPDIHNLSAFDLALNYFHSYGYQSEASLWADLLLEKGGADVNRASDPAGLPPLLSESVQEQRIVWLLKHRANPSYVHQTGTSALVVFLLQGFRAETERLIKHLLTHHMDMSITQRPLSAGMAGVDVEPAYLGLTPLQVAIKRNLFEATKLLLEADASLNQMRGWLEEQLGEGGEITADLQEGGVRHDEAHEWRPLFAYIMAQCTTDSQPLALKSLARTCILQQMTRLPECQGQVKATSEDDLELKVKQLGLPVMMERYILWKSYLEDRMEEIDHFMDKYKENKRRTSR